MRGLYGRLPALNRIAIELEGPGDDSLAEGLRVVPGVATVESAPGRLPVGVDDLNGATPAVFGWLASRGVRFTHAVTERPDLETVFLTLTGRSLRDP